MSLAFLPLFAGIMAISSIPHGIRIPLAVIVVVLLWWGPFACCRTPPASRAWR
jgi:hypothetical protein